MLKKIFWVSLFLLLFLIGGSSLFLLTQKKFIKSQAIIALNEQLDAEVTVHGNIDLSILSSFPNVNLELHEVYINDKLRAGDTLANIQLVSLSLNPWKVLRKDYTIDEIKTERGFLKLFIDEKGLSNFNILKKVEDKNKESQILQLQKISVNQMDITYLDLQNDIEIQAFSDNSVVAGEFQDENFEMNISSKLLSKKLLIGETSLLNQQKMEGSVRLNFTSKDGCLLFDDSEILISENTFVVDGTICTKDKTIDLKAQASGDKLENVLSLVPSNWLNLEDIKGKGKYLVNASVVGFFEDPKVLMNFEISKGILDLPSQKYSLTQLNTKGFFSNEKTKEGSLKLTSFNFKLDESNLNGSLEIPDLSKISIISNLTGEIKQPLLAKLIPDSVSIKSGSIAINNLKLVVNQSELDSLWLLQQVEGSISLNELEGKIYSLEMPYKCSGSLIGTANYLSALDLNLELGVNQLSFDGELKNLLEIILNKENHTELELGLIGRLTSSYFNLNDFIREDRSSNEKQKEISFPSINGKLKIDMKEFIYQELTLKDVNINAVAKNTNYNFEIIQAKGLGGVLKGNLLTNVNGSDFEVNLSCNIKQMNVAEAFLAFDNFGQESFGSKNIKGNLNAQLNMTATWNNFKEFDQDEFLLQSHIELTDGELINFAPLLSLSGKLDVEQLEHIYFTDLQTDVSVLNRSIEFKLTEIQSNLVSLKLGGTHSFDNEINYSLILNLKNLLAAKFKKNKTLDKSYVNNVMGGINLYISMTGTMDNPIISYDKDNVKEKIKQDFKDEKSEFKNLFKKNEKSEFEKNEIKFEELKEEDKYLEWEEE